MEHLGQTKRPTGFRVDARTIEQINSLKNVDGSKSFQEFCERAVKFYISYLSGKDHENYVTRTLDSALQGRFNQLEADLKRSNSKVAIAVTELMLATLLTTDFTPEELRRIRGRAAEMVQKYGGSASLLQSQPEAADLAGDTLREEDDPFRD